MHPLLLWVLLVLVLYGIREHVHWNARTSIIFEPQLAGQSAGDQVRVTVDGEAGFTRTPVPVGRHTITITHPKADPITTNLFAWYGRNDMGTIELVRSTGTLIVTALPPARLIRVEGPEFSITLTNSNGQKFTVPTDTYRVSADYAHWSDVVQVPVKRGETSTKVFAPRLGMAELEASHPGATFTLYASNGSRLEHGNLPAFIPELPEGDYRLEGVRGKYRQSEALVVKANETNRARVAFPYGAVNLVSHPKGAKVWDGEGNEWGLTPLQRLEVEPGEWKLVFTHARYETASFTMTVEANQTNHFQTNLVSLAYREAMRSGREQFRRGQFEEAHSSATKALAEMPMDLGALALQKEASGQVHMLKAMDWMLQQNFDEAQNEIRLARERLTNTFKLKEIADEIDRLKAVKLERERLAAEEDRRRTRQKRIVDIDQALNIHAGQYPQSGLYRRHELETKMAADKARDAIHEALRNEPGAFEVSRSESAGEKVFVLHGKQKVGIGGIRHCVIAVGETEPGVTRIVFKVLEYTAQLEVAVEGLLSVKSNMKLIPVSQDNNLSAASANARVSEGTASVLKRIQSGCGN